MPLQRAAVSSLRIAAVSCRRNAVTRRNIKLPYHAVAAVDRYCRSLVHPANSPPRRALHAVSPPRRGSHADARPPSPLPSLVPAASAAFPSRRLYHPAATAASAACPRCTSAARPLHIRRPPPRSICSLSPPAFLVLLSHQSAAPSVRHRNSRLQLPSDPSLVPPEGRRSSLHSTPSVSLQKKVKLKCGVVCVCRPLGVPQWIAPTNSCATGACCGSETPSHTTHAAACCLAMQRTCRHLSSPYLPLHIDPATGPAPAPYRPGYRPGACSVL